MTLPNLFSFIFGQKILKTGWVSGLNVNLHTR